MSNPFVLHHFVQVFYQFSNRLVSLFLVSILPILLFSILNDFLQSEIALLCTVIFTIVLLVAKFKYVNKFIVTKIIEKSIASKTSKGYGAEFVKSVIQTGTSNTFISDANIYTSGMVQSKDLLDKDIKFLYANILEKMEEAEYEMVRLSIINKERFKDDNENAFKIIVINEVQSLIEVNKNNINLYNSILKNIETSNNNDGFLLKTQNVIGLCGKLADSEFYTARELKNSMLETVKVL